MEKVFKFEPLDIIRPIGNFKDLKENGRYIVLKHVTDHPQYGNSYKLFNLYTGDRNVYPALFANERFIEWEGMSAK